MEAESGKAPVGVWNEVVTNGRNSRAGPPVPPAGGPTEVATTTQGATGEATGRRASITEATKAEATATEESTGVTRNTKRKAEATKSAAAYGVTFER